MEGHILTHCVAIVTELAFGVTLWYPEDYFTLRGTFMADSPTNDLYLFLFSPQAAIRDGACTVAIPAPEDAYYWSFQSDGSNPLSDEILDEVCPPQVLYQTCLLERHWSKQDYRLIRDFLLAKGLNPNSPDLVNQLGYPLAVIDPEPLPLDGVIHILSYLTVH